jgi:hypothetical protein
MTHVVSGKPNIRPYLSKGNKWSNSFPIYACPLGVMLHQFVYVIRDDQRSQRFRRYNSVVNQVPPLHQYNHVTILYGRSPVLHRRFKKNWGKYWEKNVRSANSPWARISSEECLKIQVGLVTRLRAGRYWVPIPADAKSTHRLWGPPSLLFKGYRCSFPGVKRPGIEVNQLFPSRVEVHNKWSYNCTPPICLHGVDRDKFVTTSQKTLCLIKRSAVKFDYGNNFNMRIVRIT